MKQKQSEREKQKQNVSKCFRNNFELSKNCNIPPQVPVIVCQFTSKESSLKSLIKPPKHTLALTA